MLSNEERELIEEIQKGNKIGIYELIRTFKREGIENFITVRRKYIDIIINLIEKQSKEIEEYKKQLDLDYVDKHFVPVERYNQLEKEIEELKEKSNHITKETVEFVNSHYIHKDKIEAKIEELEKEKNIPEEMDFKAFYRIKDLKI